ncbi:MAG: pyruvate dehydrogenase complex dihydrolipoamide acetyltransferase [Gemmatimonadetes bacterium]|nr:pyruvate dehydrogenase complex dihydrolipoamide acetyltransferase [Gemmatimonadota bacterium]
MGTKVHMEALSPTMEEGQVVKWLKGEGDEVSSGQVLAEIETDKATMELVARGDGVLRKILVGEGGTAPVGSVIAVIAEADEDISALVRDGRAGAAVGGAGAEPAKAPQAPPAAQPERAAAPRPSPVAGAPAAARPAASAPAATGDGEDGRGRVRASPLARRLAADAGLELGRVAGTGPGGRIIKRDIEAALAEAAAAPARAPALELADYEDVPLTQIRKTIAKRLVQSLGPVPHFFLTIDVDMTGMVRARERINAFLGAQGVKVSINDMVIRATAAALQRHPECNAAWTGEGIRRYNRVHIGVAVAGEEGLITPVIRDADRKGLAELSTEFRELAQRGREKKLKPEEYTGSTFSISNLGMFGIYEFTAVINPPEAGILAVGAVEERAVVKGGQVVVEPRMRVTMSCDHRVIDGAMGARFLQTLRAMLEEPAAILM